MLLICVFFILICLSFSTFNSFLCLESNKGKSSLSTINENLRIMGDEMIEGREECDHLSYLAVPFTHSIPRAGYRDKMGCHL